MCMCKKCGSCMGWLVLVAGVLLLLKNLNVWTFWGIDGWTLAFIIAGFAMIGSGCCKKCCSGSCDVNAAPKKVSKKRK